MEGLSRRDWLKSVSAAAIGGALAAAQGAQPGKEAEMVEIPTGPFLMGTPEEVARRLAEEAGYHPSWLGGEAPQRTVEVAAFRIDRYPVTHAEYLEFCEATGHRRPMMWRNGQPAEVLLNHPVCAVNQADALAYAQWAGKRLPSEAEWEKAARGTDGRIWPWGDEFDPDACTWNRDDRGDIQLGTTPVDAHPGGASPYGVMDLAGNVAEWCADSPGPGAAYIKGGSWIVTQPFLLRPAARILSGFANNPMTFYGFRCAQEVQ